MMKLLITTEKVALLAVLVSSFATLACNGQDTPAQSKPLSEAVSFDSFPEGSYIERFDVVEAKEQTTFNIDIHVAKPVAETTAWLRSKLPQGQGGDSDVMSIKQAAFGREVTLKIESAGDLTKSILRIGMVQKGPATSKLGEFIPKVFPKTSISSMHFGIAQPDSSIDPMFSVEAASTSEMATISSYAFKAGLKEKRSTSDLKVFTAGPKAPWVTAVSLIRIPEKTSIMIGISFIPDVYYKSAD